MMSLTCRRLLTLGALILALGSAACDDDDPTPCTCGSSGGCAGDGGGGGGATGGGGGTGGSCAGSSCQPEGITTATGAVVGLVATSRYVFWYDTGSETISRFDKAESTLDDPWTTAQGDVTLLAPGPERLYWYSAVSPCAIRYKPYDSEPSEQVEEVWSGTSCNAISLAVGSDSTVFFGSDAITDRIYHIEGGNPMELYQVELPRQVVVDEIQIGCLSGTGAATELRHGPNAPPGTLNVPPKAAAGALGLVLRDGTFYWHTATAISKYTPSQPASETLAVGVNAAVIAVDPAGDYVYWLDDASKRLWRVSTSADPAAKPAIVAVRPEGTPELPLLAVDDDTAYWVSGSTIMRVVLPAP